jgi:hypothetical protein
VHLSYYEFHEILTLELKSVCYCGQFSLHFNFFFILNICIRTYFLIVTFCHVKYLIHFPTLMLCSSCDKDELWSVTANSFVVQDINFLHQMLLVLPPLWGWWITMMMEAIHISEMSVYNHETTQQYIAESCHLHFLPFHSEHLHASI